MMEKEWVRKMVEALRVSWKKYRLVWLVICGGLLLILLPAGRGEAEEGETVSPEAAETFDVSAAENRMAEALSKIEGAGEVTVVLTIQNGPKQILAEDTELGGNPAESRRETVVLSKGSSQEETVTVQEISPQYQGALVVCPGGDDPEVRLKLTEGVTALTGLGADKISISKGK